jgi:efflux ABC transporter, permease protein
MIPTMKRDLLKQIRNEWKDNIWLVIELAVVAASIWVLVFVLYARVKYNYSPRGFDPDDVYYLSVRRIDDKSPEYVAPADSADADFYTDRKDLLRRLRENPYVEAAAISSNGLPYNYNFNGWNFFLYDRLDSVGYLGNARRVSPDMVDVLRYESLTGMDRKQLKAALERGEILISDNMIDEEAGRDPKKLIGERMVIGNDSSHVYKVADVIRCVRRSDYEPPFRGSIIIPLVEDKRWTSEIAVRVKPGKGREFVESFRADKNLQRQRNVYLTDLKSLADIREACQRGMDVQVRMYFVVIAFLLVTIFLGLLGTFWFRMQQRISEIAIRKVSGATRPQVFRRIIGEGMILLVCGMLIASACIWPLVSSDEFGYMGEKWYMALLMECITMVLVAAGIVVSLWYPARKAMDIEPAIAIKAE